MRGTQRTCAARRTHTQKAVLSEPCLPQSYVVCCCKHARWRVDTRMLELGHFNTRTRGPALGSQAAGYSAPRPSAFSRFLARPL